MFYVTKIKDPGMCPRCKTNSVSSMDDWGDDLYLYVFCHKCKRYMDREKHLLHRAIIVIEEEKTLDQAI